MIKDELSVKEAPVISICLVHKDTNDVVDNDNDRKMVMLVITIVIIMIVIVLKTIMLMLMMLISGTPLMLIIK